MNPEAVLSNNQIRFWGIFEAIVVENEDPLNRNRVRVRNDFFYGSGLSPWAVVLVPYGGFNQVGTVFPLEKGTGVFIQFKNGLPNTPVVIGCWYAKPKGVSEFPNEISSPDIKVIKTKKTTITLNDTSDNTKITIETSGGAKIVFEDDVPGIGPQITLIAGKSFVFNKDTQL